MGGAALVAAQYIFKDSIAAAWDAYLGGANGAFDPLIFAHVAGGLVILALVLWRIVLCVRRGAPPPPEREHPLLKRLAHLGFYAVLIGLSVSGALAWFAGVQPAAGLHNVLKVALLALLALIAFHVVAVVFHQLVLKTAIMQRMIRAAP